MLKALIKKQFAELKSFYFRENKGKKVGRSLGPVGFAVLYAFVYISISFSFFALAQALGSFLLTSGNDWLYFSLTGILAISLSAIINSLSTYSILYSSKDNEALLSLPIPPSKILFSRMIAVYAMGLLYEAMVMIPAVAVYVLFGNTGFKTIAAAIALVIVISFFALALICVLGFFVAKITVKLKNRSIITVLASLVFIVGIYYVQFRLNTFIENVALYSNEIGEAIKKYLYPFYQMGLAFCGSGKAFAIFTAITAALFGAVYAMLSKSFVSIVTQNRGIKKAEYKEKAVKSKSVKSALLGRELKRFVNSPTYMLNMGLGLIILIGIAVFAAVRGDMIAERLGAVLAEAPPEAKASLPAIAACAVCLVSAMNAITAPSISLEGKTLWLAQSLPVSPAAIFDAKINMHTLLCFPPAALCTVALEHALGASPVEYVCALLLALAFIYLCAEAGIASNLNKPVFNWTNEAVPVKQSTSVALVMFGGWIISALLGALCLFSGINCTVIMAAAAVVLGGAALLLDRRLKTKGVNQFEAL